MKKAICILILSAFMTAPAVAGPYPTVDVKNTGVDPYLGMTVYSSHNPGGIGLVTGVYTLELKNASNPIPGHPEYLGDGSDTAVTVESFCIDIWDTNPTDFLEYEVKPLDETPDPAAGPMGQKRASYLAELLDKNWKTVMTDTEKVALQLAVWEVVDEQMGYDDIDASDFDIRTLSDLGFGFKATAATYDTERQDILNKADEMLDTITTGHSFDHYRGLSNSTPPDDKPWGTYQDYVVRVPVPAAVLLGFLGLGAAGLKLRKFA